MKLEDAWSKLQSCREAHGQAVAAIAKELKSVDAAIATLQQAKARMEQLRQAESARAKSVSESVAALQALFPSVLAGLAPKSPAPSGEVAVALQEGAAVARDARDLVVQVETRVVSTDHVHIVRTADGLMFAAIAEDGTVGNYTPHPGAGLPNMAGRWARESDGRWREDNGADVVMRSGIADGSGAAP